MMVDAIDQFLGPKREDFKRWDREARAAGGLYQGLRDLEAVRSHHSGRARRIGTVQCRLRAGLEPTLTRQLRLAPVTPTVPSV